MTISQKGILTEHFRNQIQAMGGEVLDIDNQQYQHGPSYIVGNRGYMQLIEIMEADTALSEEQQLDFDKLFNFGFSIFALRGLAEIDNFLASLKLRSEAVDKQMAEQAALMGALQ